MQAAIAPRGDARTYLLHFTGGGLDDDRYVVQRFVSRSSGEIVAVEEAASGGKGRRRSRGTVVPLAEVEKLRPARDEIIIATGVKRRNSGLQLWGWRALSLFTDRRQRG